MVLSLSATTTSFQIALTIQAIPPPKSLSLA
jgi:hypothetical protein